MWQELKFLFSGIFGQDQEESERTRSHPGLCLGLGPIIITSEEDVRKNIAKFFLISILIGLVGISTAVAQSDWVTFRNTQYKFRFIYPSDWHISTPRGYNVRGSVTSPNTKPPANCNIVVGYVPKLSRFTQAELDREVNTARWSNQDWEEILSEKFPDVHVFETRKIKVDNRPAQSTVAIYTYETIKAKLYGKSMFFYRVTPGLVWHFTCSAEGVTYREAEQNFEYWKTTFQRIVSSFVFEN